MIYFTADQHFDHEAIIHHCNRPFRTTNHMNKEIIRRYNSVIQKSDTVYFVGDFSTRSVSYKEALRNMASKLKGIKHLILGNHDCLGAFDYIDIGFTSVHTALELGEFVLHHDPSAACAIGDRKLIHGHIHTLFKRCNNALNVGVDVWDFTPVSMEQVEQEFNTDEE